MAGITTSEVRTNAWSLNDYYRQSLQFNDKNRRYIGGGQLWMWGKNDYGQSGQGSTNNGYSSPVQVPGVWRTVWATGNNTYATKPDGSLWSWGRNNDGQLGHGDKTDYSSPKQVKGGSGPGNWAYVTATRENTYCLKYDGSLWSWGRNTYSMLLQGAGGGTHDLNKGYSPVPVIGTGYNDYDWSTVETEFARQSYGGCFMKNDGSLWSWGENAYGELGLQKTMTALSSPNQIPGDWTGSKIAADGPMMAAAKPDGTLWAWGRNYWGNLGQNTAGNPANRSSPVQIPGTNWHRPIVDSLSMFCVRGDGTLWCCGDNGQGRLGQNMADAPGSARSSMVQIPGTTWTGSISASYGTIIAKKSDGTLWGWGRNTNGQLGLNTVVAHSSPIQIGSDTNWGVNTWGGTFPSRMGSYGAAIGVIKPIQ